MTPEAIKHLRSTLGLTQAQLAVALDVSLDTVKSWESGRLAPGARRIQHMTIMIQPGNVLATRLSDTLSDAADLAEARSADYIASGHPEGAESAIRLAGHLRRLSATHREMSATDPLADPVQVEGA